jgi:hypothetical protein
VARKLYQVAAWAALSAIVVLTVVPLGLRLTRPMTSSTRAGNKRASSLVRCAAAFALAVLILSLSATGLHVGAGRSEGADCRAVVPADQVAPEGCTLRLRSPGDRS